jgi:ketosteroid isomerase-like protein
VPTAPGSESDFLKAFRQAYDEANRAWNEGDIKRAYAALAEDVDYRLAPTWPSARPLRGRDEVIGFFQDLRETFPDVRGEVIEVSQVDQTTTLTGTKVTGSGASSRAGTEMEIWQIWELGERLVPFRITEFLDREAAVQAVRGKEVTERAQ